MTKEQLVLTEEQLAEVMNNLEQWFDKFEPEVRLYGHVALQVIRQLWAERDRHRAVMAQAKAAIDDLRGTIDRDGIGAWSSRSPQAIAAMQALAALKSMGV